MRTWSRSPVSFACGNCAAILMPGEPVLKLFVPGLKHPKFRCVQCAGEDPPADLPTQAARQPGLILTQVDEDGIERPLPQATGPTSLKTQAERFDWKAVQAGEK